MVPTISSRLVRKPTTTACPRNRRRAAEVRPLKAGVVDTAYGPGLYFVGPNVTMHTFPGEIHVLEASYDREEAQIKGGPSLPVP